MANGWMVLAGICVGLGAGSGLMAHAQAAPATAPAPAPAAAAAPAAVKRTTCSVNTIPPNPAETAQNKGLFSVAEGLFRDLLAKSAANEAAHEGLVRALIAQDKVDAAAKEAETWAAASPGSSIALVALGETRLRQGDPREAFLDFQKAAQADPCDARAYMGLAQVDGLAGLHASAKRLIEQAYALHPSDDEIHGAWIETRPRKERLERLTDYAEHSDQISDDNRAKMKASLEKASLDSSSNCRAAPASPETATVPMTEIMDGPNRFVGWGLDVKFNGKGRRLQIDTGAGGIMISRVAAMFLGVQREDASQAWGIGDKGKVKTSIAHVASIKIGGIEFTNCRVEILEKWSALESDGLIGGDVFARSQLTLDFPKHQLRIAPLPPRPGTAKPQAAPDAAANDDDEEWHDPYIAPEMARWEHIYLSGHDILMPTGIVDTKRIKDSSAWRDKLFILDTGAESNLISTSAAKEVTKIGRDEENGIRGISGDVDKVYDAGRFTLAFAGLRLDSPSMTSFDMTAASHDDGVEVSGFIGAPALFQLVMHIDYRDNLVWCEFTPRN